MVVTMYEWIAQLLSAYETATGKRHSKIAEAIRLDHPEVIAETMDWYLRQLNLERGGDGSSG